MRTTPFKIRVKPRASKSRHFALGVVYAAEILWKGILGTRRRGAVRREREGQITAYHSRLKAKPLSFTGIGRRRGRGGFQDEQFHQGIHFTRLTRQSVENE